VELTEKDIDEFIEIYERVYKERISRDDAREMANRLLTLYEILAQPLPGEIESEAVKDEKGSNSRPG